jgi:hypothetical protein
MKVRIEHYDAERVPDTRPGRKATLTTFLMVRELIVEVCERHGGVDAFGKKAFWVVDDMYNDERYQYLEICKPGALTEKWLLDLMRLLEKQPAWGVGIGFSEGYVLVFADRLMVNGPTFKAATSLQDVIEFARAALELQELIRATTDDQGLSRLVRVPGISERRLDLTLPNVTNDGLKLVAKLSKVQALVLDGSKVTDAGLIHLRELGELRRLYLQNTQVIGNGLRHLEHQKNLEELFFASCPLTEKAFQHLGRMTQLKTLHLQETPLNDILMAHLTTLRGIENFAIGGTRIGDQGLARLADFKNLKRLDLFGTRVSDASLPLLESMTNLESLNLSMSKVSRSGIKRLQKKLPKCVIYS